MILPPELAEWAEAIFGIYFELREGKIGGVGNAVAIASFGKVAVALTAAHNVDALNKLAVAGSPFSDLREAREVNPTFRGKLKAALAERRVDGDQDLSLVEFEAPPVGTSDVATVFLRQRKASRHRFTKHFGLKLLPPPVGDVVSAIGMHGFESLGVEDAGDDGERWMFKNECRIIPAVVTSHASEGPNSVQDGFEVEGEFPSGLSGSPVLWRHSDNILVCGVVSRSFEGLNQATVASSQAALRLTVRFDDEHPAVPIHELAKRGLVPTYSNELDAFCEHAVLP